MFYGSLLIFYCLLFSIAQYQFWTLAVTISGWLATLVVLIMALVFILRRKRQRERKYYNMLLLFIVLKD